MEPTSHVPPAASAPNRIDVRPAVLADIDDVVAIEGRAFGDPWARQSFEQLLGDLRVHFAVATIGPESPREGGAIPERRVAGYVVAWYVMDEGEIANLAVAPWARGRGIGGTLLDSAIALARARAVATMYLEVRDSNQVARSLYASRGFYQVTRRRRYYRHPVEDALVLRLDVGRE